MKANRSRPVRLSTLALVSAAIASLALSLPGLTVLPARGQASSTLLTGSVTNSVPATGLSRNDLPTQHAIDVEDDQHDSNDAALDYSGREENVEHDYHLKGIEQSQVPAETKQEAIADENERHQNSQTALQRQRSEEDARHAKRLADIMAAAGRLLSGAASAAGNGLNNSNGGGGQPGGGAPSQPPANPPTSYPTNPPTNYSGNPPTTFPATPPTTYSGAPLTAPPPAPTQPNTGNPPTTYSGVPLTAPPAQTPPSTGNPPASSAGNNPPPQDSAPSGVAQKPPAPLDFIPDALNNALKQVPNGSRILQGAAEVSRAAGQGAADSITNDLQNLQNTTRQIAQPLEDSWTKDPYGGAKQVAGVFAFEGLGAGLQGALATRGAMQAGAPLSSALRTGGSSALRGSVLGGPNGLGGLASRGSGTLGGEAPNAGGAGSGPLTGNVGENQGLPTENAGGGNGGPGEPGGGGQPPAEPASPDESGPSAGTQFPPAADPISRGMPPPVDSALKALAKAKKWIIVVRDSNPAAERWVGEPGYLPKPQALKAKTIPFDPAKPLSEQPNAGLVRADQLTQQEKNLGYQIDPNTGLVSQGGNHFYSDIDLHGVYDSAGNDVTRQFFNELMNNPQYGNGKLQDLIQHYPQDWWQFRNTPEVAGTNYGPQVGGGKTATAYLPDSTVRLDTIAQMRALYTENKINFSTLYPHH